MAALLGSMRLPLSLSVGDRQFEVGELTVDLEVDGQGKVKIPDIISELRRTLNEMPDDA